MLSKNVFTFPFYLPRIFTLCANWPEYLYNYLTRKRRRGEYRMRNGIRLVDEMGDVPGTMAVVFVRQEYGALKEFRTIVDIGAHLGVFAVYAASSCPDARIYCYEPEERNFDQLKFNVSLNELRPRVSTVRCAVASTDEPRDLALDGSLLNSFHLIPEKPRYQKV